MFHFFQETFRLCQSVFLKEVLLIVSGPDFGQDSRAYYWCTGIAVTLFVQWVLLHRCFFAADRIGVNLKSVTLGLIYKKVKIHNMLSYYQMR